MTWQPLFAPDPLNDPRGRLVSVRRRFVTNSVSTWLGAMASVGKRAPRLQQRRGGFRVYRDVPYVDDGDAMHLLDVYAPVAVGPPRPVMLYLHGGGFRFGDKGTHAWFGAKYAQAGFVCAVPSYRLGPTHLYPAPLHDSAAAAIFLAKYADRFGGEVGRLHLAGESAGGNLALAVALAATHRFEDPALTALFDADVRLASLTVACGLLQTSDPGRFRRRRPSLPRWLDDVIWSACLNYVGRDRLGGVGLSDPIRFLEGAGGFARPFPPTYAFCGTADPILDDTRRLVSALERRGVPVAHDLFPGEAHVFHAQPWRPAAKVAWRRSLDFATTPVVR